MSIFYLLVPQWGVSYFLAHLISNPFEPLATYSLANFPCKSLVGYYFSSKSEFGTPSDQNPIFEVSLSEDSTSS